MARELSQPKDTASDNIGELYATVKEAEMAFKDADREASLARSRVTSALNKLNDAQKALDNALEAARKKSPLESDWRRQEREKKNVSLP